MEVIYERCCGLDVHKQTVAACLLTPGASGQPTKAVRTFGTTTAALLALSDWLTQAGCTHVAMEATGVYWQPIWNLLEGSFRLPLVNAQHIKAVPGRKTAVRDAEWLADLLRHGLLRGSFVPDRAQRELRELTRHRTGLIRERAAEANRLQKTPEGANIKLGSVATNVLGVSGRQMLEALIGGASDAALPAELAVGKLRGKLPELRRALEGKVRPHQRFLLAQQLAHIDYLDGAIAGASAAIAERLRPFEAALRRLDAIPGIARTTAEVLLAELGPDLSRFRSAGCLASWAGLCPGNHESAVKRHSGRTRKGSPWLRAARVQAAQAAARTKRSSFATQYHRLAARRGAKRAIVAVAHSLLVVVYHLLTEQTDYQDLGPDYLDQRLERLGLYVQVTPKQPAA